MNPDETLQQTPITPLLPTETVGGGLARLLGQREFILRVLAGGLLLSLLLCAILGAGLLTALHKRTQIVVLDPSGGLASGEGESWKEARELHEEIARLATAALLTRTPNGFELGNFQALLFEREPLALAQQLRLNEQPDFAQRQLRQSPEIARIETRTSAWSGIEALVAGHLVRTGQFGGQPVDEIIPFTLRLTLAPNPDYARARRYPLIVTTFTLNYETRTP